MTRPPEWFFAALNKLMTKTYENTMIKKPILCLVVDADFGLSSLGLLPGESVDIYTTAGPMTVTADRPERRELPRVVCGKGGCRLHPLHVGKHDGNCGCLNGCAAWECPNL